MTLKLLLWVKINTLGILKHVNMFRFRKRYPSPSSHGLPVTQRSHQINARYDFDVIYMDIRHCHITVITVTSHDRHGASNHRPLDGLFNNLFQASIKLKASKLRSNSPLSWESADDRWIPLRKGQHYRMRVHAMTSSWRCNDYFIITSWIRAGVCIAWVF